MKPHQHDPVLCFVRLPWVWFSFVECDDPVLAGTDWGWPYSTDAANPAWPSDVLRVALGPGGVCGPNALTRPPTPLEINATRGPWLYDSKCDGVAHAGMKLSEFREVMRERGVELYEPAWPGRPAFSPIEPGLGEPRTAPTYPWPRDVVPGLRSMIEVGGPTMFRVGLLAGDGERLPEVFIVVDREDGRVAVNLNIVDAAMLGVGLSRAVASAGFDWGRVHEYRRSKSQRHMMVDGIVAGFDIGASLEETAQNLAAAWNKAAGYGPGEGAHAEGTKVVWPTATWHPAHEAAEKTAAPTLEEDEPSEGDVADALAMAESVGQEVAGG